jgi:hypothetical protein
MQAGSKCACIERRWPGVNRTESKRKIVAIAERRITFSAASVGGVPATSFLAPPLDPGWTT